MTRSKVLSDADLQVALLNSIAEHRDKRIQVADLLPPFIKDVLDSIEPQFVLGCLKTPFLG